MATERERILELVDLATAPSKMSKQQALDWIEELITDLEPRAEALRDEIKIAERE